MSTDPDEIRQDIARTRDNLSDDVDALAYKASPRRMVEDRKRRVGHAVRRVTDKVMGGASEAGEVVSDRVSSAASAVGDAASAAPRQLKQRAEGNPIAAGLIAFAAGWLVSSVLPASRREQEAAGRVKDAVQGHSDAIKEELGGVAQDMRDSLREPARDATEAVKSTTQEAVQTVKDETGTAANDVKDEIGDAREQVRS